MIDSIYEGLTEVNNILKLRGNVGNTYGCDNDAYMLGYCNAQMIVARLLVEDMICEIKASKQSVEQKELQEHKESLEHTDDFKNNPKTVF